MSLWSFPKKVFLELGIFNLKAKAWEKGKDRGQFLPNPEFSGPVIHKKKFFFGLFLQQFTTIMPERRFYLYGRVWGYLKHFCISNELFIRSENFAKKK